VECGIFDKVTKPAYNNENRPEPLAVRGMIIKERGMT
jgi:hypothetical protein